MAETDGTAQPTFQISLAQDVEPIPPSTSGDLKAEGAVIVQGIISGEQFVSPELAMQISQAGGQVAAAESMTSSSAPVVVQSSVMGTGQTTDGEPAYVAEQIGMHEVAAVVESLPGVVSQHVMVDMSRTAPEGQDVPIDGNFQQGHVISQTTPDGVAGVEVDGVPDQMQTSSASDGHDVIIEVHQVPDHDLLLSMADANPESERAEAENADATVETGSEPLKDAVAEVESIPSDDAPQPKEGQGEKEASKEAKEVIFVCIHGQSFRCRPQAGIPVDDEVKESPVETCACSKIKKSPTVVKRPSRMAVVKGGKLARKLRNRQQLFTCDTCGGRFSNKEALDLHMVAHGDDDNEDSEDEEDKADEETTQQRTKVVTMQGRAQRRKPTQEEKACPDCGKVFSRLSALGAHKRQHKKEKLNQSLDEEDPTQKEDKTKNLSCTVCEKKFTRMYDVERHMETHTDSDRKKCTWCGNKFHSIRSKERHESLHCKRNKHNKCSHCDVVLSSKFKLLRHEREHLTSEQIESLSCKNCKKAFTNLRSLMRHEKLHLKEKGAVLHCSHCPETFEDRFSYNVHVKNHAVKAYQCDLCGMKFKHEYLLNVHTKRMTCQKKRQSLQDVQCNICHKTVKGTATLKRHMRTHTKEKPYPCRIGCNASFSSTSNRLSHERMYCKLSPSYLCTHCGEVLSNQARLIYHESKYHGIGPLVGGQRTSNTEYPCRHCGKVFFFKGGRKRHERIHTDEKPYMCQFCPKAFVHASALVCHERVHTKERPYVCKECNKAFSQATHLKTHIRVHTKEKPYKCRFCDKAFSHMGTRKSHEGTHKSTTEPGPQPAVTQEQAAAKFHMPQEEHHVVVHPEIKVIHHDTEPVPHKVHISHHEHEVQAADVILQLLESGSRVSNFEGLVHMASS